MKTVTMTRAIIVTTLLAVFPVTAGAAGNGTNEGAKAPEAVVGDAQFLHDILQDGVSNAVGLNLAMRGKFRATHYRAKFGALGGAFCQQASGYSVPRSVDLPYLRDMTSMPDGEVVLCFIGQRYENGVLVAEQLLSEPTIYSWRKETLNPASRIPTAVINDELFLAEIADGTSDMTAINVPVRLRFKGTHYAYKFGRVSEIVCTEDGNYSSYIPSSTPLNLDIAMIENGAVNLCLRGATIENGVLTYEQLITEPTVYAWTKDGADIIPPGSFTVTGPAGLLTDQTPIVSFLAAYGADFYDVTIAADDACSAVVQSFSDVTATAFELSTPLLDGTYYTCVTARDYAGNTTAATNNGLVEFTVDANPPAPFSIISPSGTIADATPEILWEVAAGASVYDVVISTSSDCSAAVQQATGLTVTSFTASALVDGTYYTCVIARDLAGNTTEALNSGLGFVVNTAPAAWHRMFVTSTQSGIKSSIAVPPDYPNFGGLNAADWICTYAAYTAGYVPGWNGLSLVYKAVLSIPGNDARDRIPVSGPIYNTHGDLLATGHADLWDGMLQNPVRYDEKGRLITTNLEVWSGTNPDGRSMLDTCGSWVSPGSTLSGNVGYLHLYASQWILGSSKTCNLTARLYCISPPIQ